MLNRRTRAGPRGALRVVRHEAWCLMTTWEWPRKKGQVGNVYAVLVVRCRKRRYGESKVQSH